MSGLTSQITIHLQARMYRQRVRGPETPEPLQYSINQEGHAAIVKCEGDNARPATALSEGGLGFAIKYYHFHNANGDVAPAVFIIADDTMGLKDFFFEEVVGLSHTQLVDATGYLVFTKTRNCNDAFYRWYAHYIVVPFVELCRDSHRCKNSDLTPMRAFVISDSSVPRAICSGRNERDTH